MDDTKELARDLRDALALLTRALTVLGAHVEAGRDELRHINTELTRILGRVERREGLD